jgi:hypothetical protein
VLRDSSIFSNSAGFSGRHASSSRSKPANVTQSVLLGESFGSKHESFGESIMKPAFAKCGLFQKFRAFSKSLWRPKDPSCGAPYA